MNFKRWYGFLFVSFLLVFWGQSGVKVVAQGQVDLAVQWQAKVDPFVLNSITNGDTEFLLVLSEQADLSGAEALTTKTAKGEYVYQQLTAAAQRSQGPVREVLENAKVPFRAFWIANMFWVRGNAQVLQALASRPDVAAVYGNPRIQEMLPEPDLLSPLELMIPQFANSIASNVSHINAPAVWDLGFTGQGVVIGGQDTGYQWDHPALINQYRGWDGSTADHDYNWHDAIHEDDPHTADGNPCGFDAVEPCDDYGHGTHTMGTMVGDDGGSNQIGIAPGAKWIACRNMEQGWGSPATYIECYEWFIAPYPVGGNPLTDGDPTKAPDIINNSWGCPPIEGCDPESLHAAVKAVRAAGILTVHSAGNYGSSCSTVRDPATIYADSFSVGATQVSWDSDTGNEVIASISSRGPVTIDGSGRMKPDISAPGVNIRSSTRNGGYSTSTGTSMAAPHVAGSAALLLSAYPHLAGNVDLIETVLEDTAVPFTTNQGCGGDTPTSVPNNVYGHGRVDALRAVNTSSRINLEMDWYPGEAVPGALITYSLTVAHLAGTENVHNVVVSSTLPTQTTFITATVPYTISGSIIKWEQSVLVSQSDMSFQMVVRLNPNTLGTVDVLDFGAAADGQEFIPGKPFSIPIKYKMFLPFVGAP